MHARSGLKTEYMSEEWMRCIEACAREAEKLGMNAWAYDENGWPSGFAGGKLLEEEDNRDQYITYERGALDPKATVSYRMEEDCLVRISVETEEDCPTQVSAGAEGEYLNLYIHVAASTADILNPEVVDQFLALTHEKYLEHFGERFSEEIKGFFTDEPQYQRWGTPYTKMIARYFAEQYQEDILDSLGLLFVEKEGYRSFRYRYWKGMQELMLRSFAEKVYDWCEEHKVRLTGHYVEESTLGMQLMCCGGVMPFYEFEHIPGIDWLGKGSDNELASRQVGSAAAQLGKKQVLTETFGCCGWDVSPAELRRIAGFQYVNGVNLMCQHLIPYEEYGNRKHDYPAHYSPVNPWVREEFLAFNDSFTRLGYLLAEGKEQVNVAMLHPIRSAYFDYKRELQEDNFFGIRELEEQTRKACRTLSGANIAYHFLDETLLARHGFVADGTIGCGECSYAYLVIPPILTMDRSTEKLLYAYVAQGGKLLLLGGKPCWLEAEPYDYPYLESNCTLEEIRKAQPYQVKDCNTMIYSTLRTLDGTAYLYAVNASDKEEYTQTFQLGAEVRSFQKLDLVTLERKRVPLTVTLKPGETALLFADNEEAEKIQKLQPYSLRFQNATVGFEENYLPVDYVRYSTDGVHYSEKWPCAALFQKLLADRLSGTVFFQYEFQVEKKPERIWLRVEDCNARSASINGVSLTETVPCGIEEHVIAYDVAPYLVEGKNVYTVEMDWHESEDVYYALFGENVTESLKNCIVYDSELEPVYLAGTFGVYPSGGYQEDSDARFVGADSFYIGEVPKTVSDPMLEGLPFVAGAVTLTQTVVWANPGILLEIEGNYHLAAVWINGQLAGKLMFDRKLDISRYAKAGENQVEIRFILSNQNLFGPQHFNGNRDGSVTPWHFELGNTWKDGKSEYYHDRYDIRKFYV